MTYKGQTLAYIRVSTAEQNLARQEYLLDETDKVFQDKLSGKDRNRPGLDELLAYARSGDHVHVHEMARLGRNNLDILNIVKQLLEEGVSITFRSERLTFTPGEEAPMAKLQLHIFAAFAEFDRTNNKIRQAEGIAEGKARGVYKGRKPSLTQEQAQEARARVASGVAKSKVARDLGISRSTLYGYLKSAPVAA